MHSGDYHERTKHHLHAYAAGPGGLDWAAQPEAFREYGDCPQIALPLANETATPSFSALADAVTPAAVPPNHAVDADALGTFLSCSLAISAWKRYGPSRWALRCNPSSGNLHPTEAYLVLPDRVGIPAGLYHYRPQDHRLEQRCGHSTELSETLFADVPADSFLLGISSIPWREAWKYGERAWRYCLLDLGHAIAALRYAASLCGWQVILLDQCADEAVACLLGLDRAEDFIPEEPEYPELLCLVTPAGSLPATPDWCSAGLASVLSARVWFGKANRLSAEHNHRWPVIHAAIRGAEKGPTASVDAAATERPAPLAFRSQDSALAVIHRRRSAQAFDGVTSLSCEAFFSIIDHSLPRASLPPWGPRPAPAQVHLVVFVHRVEVLASGIYALPRATTAVGALRSAMHETFLWEPVAEAPEHLPLFRLLLADTRQVAARCACHQDIAADSAFCVAMIGDFEQGLGVGSWGYRRLMMEAGLIGQTLYLGAEAHQMQGTGIGCFFDEALHDLFGLGDRRFQVLYQFTLGKGLVDTRIATEPPYPSRTSRATATTGGY